MPPLFKRLRRMVVGEAKNLDSPSVFHSMTLVAFLAWVGLGADGLSSSTYGPEEAFKALNEGGVDNSHLIIPLGLAMIVTIFTITAVYCQVVRLFPSGGGGYMVASRLLGPKSGLISGMALLIDYVLTVSISCSHAASALLSFMPVEWAAFKVPAVCVFIFGLILLNLRGVKESVIIMMPIFLIFLLTHAFAIGVSFFDNSETLAPFVSDSFETFTSRGAEIGWMAVLAPLIAAYAIGAGTFTGIEAVSNSMQILREPRDVTARKTMWMMAISLAAMAVGSLFVFQLSNIHASAVDFAATHGGAIADHAKTYNSFLFERITEGWSPGLGQTFIYVALISEAFLLFVAAQAGFIGGPRMLATMAPDGWVPRWFSRLSDRLVVEHGVWFMGIGAIICVLITEADVTMLVVMYSINVFITFFYSMWGMTVHWWKQRRGDRPWRRRLAISSLGTVLTIVILIIMCHENFDRGAWITVLITGAFIALAVLIKRHYHGVGKMIRKLDHLVEITPGSSTAPETVDAMAPTAVVLVSGYNGMGLHALLNVFKLFPNYFKNFVFVSVSVIDFDNLTSTEEIEAFKKNHLEQMNRYVDFVNSFGCHGEVRHVTDLDSVGALETICVAVARQYPRSLIFGGQLVFPDESWWTRILHRNASSVLQKRLHAHGIGLMVLPVKLRA